MRRGAEGGRDARCCVKAATRRLLEEQIVVVAVLGSGKKSDDMWHVPQGHSPSSRVSRTGAGQEFWRSLLLTKGAITIYLLNIFLWYSKYI